MVRIKHRYLLVNILYPEPSSISAEVTPVNKGQPVPYNVQFRRPSSDELDIKILTRLIRDTVAQLFGDYGSGKVAKSLQIKYFSAATSTMIVRVARDFYRLVWAALTWMTRLPWPIDVPCVMQVVRVSGTILKAEEEAIRRARESIRRAREEYLGHDPSSLLKPESVVSAVKGSTDRGTDDDRMLDSAMESPIENSSSEDE